jgi:N-methylhydantoinase A
MMDIHTVGAGGGSIAAIDSGGALQVGPESAGADPGPVCYGKGDRLTVTDANLLLGRLQPRFFLGGDMGLDRGRLEAVLDRSAWATAWASRWELAAGIVEVVNSNMERAVRLISVERGHDVRDFTLVSFGGAGGLHAATLARGLGIPRVLVPPHPGALSALGLLLADARRDYSQSLLARRKPSTAALDRVFAGLHRKGWRDLREDGFSRREIVATDALDVRYEGQSYDLTIPYGPGWEAAFHRAHERRYGHANPNSPLELVTARATLVGRTPKPPMPPARGRKTAVPEPLDHSRVWCDGRWRRAALYDRSALTPGHVIPGPVVIGEYSSTTYVPPGFRAEADRFHNLVLTRTSK